jgi:thaumarchaeosortase
MALFVLIVVQEHGASGLKNYSIPALFLGVVGTLYTIDNLSPWGTFTPFQIMVPATTTLASNVLNLMGYQTTVYMTSRPEYGLIPNLRAQNSKGWAEFGIAWPCAGIESLLIYTVVVLIFLSKSNIPGRARVGYFVIGAIVTYFINILRIATIFVIAIDAGQNSAAVQEFHDYYGMLYSTIWIVSYPLIIMGSQLLWERMRKPTKEIQTSTSCSLPSQPSPA